ncbi:MAG: ArsA family ATPase [Thermodesulfobacteriota bacterium]
MKNLDRLIEEKQVVICIGSGGVGKTTISSAVALEAASRGKNTLALTVDPSRRLAQALGLSRGTDSGEVPRKRMREAGYDDKGELTVKLLDVKKIFDDLIRKVSQSDDTASRILENKYYRSVADSIAGADEFMAMEALFSSYEKHSYDLIVVDTPPSEHLSGFLSAPLRLTSILDSKGFKSFFIMDRMSFGLTRLFTSVSFKFIQMIVGLEVLHDMWELFSDFEAVSEGINARAARAYDLLKSPSATFLIVTNLSEPSIENTIKWEQDLCSEGYGVEAIVVNRTKEINDTTGIKIFDEADLTNNTKLREKLLKLYKDYRHEADAEKKAMRKLCMRSSCFAVPEICSEVIGLGDLRELGRSLFG